MQKTFSLFLALNLFLQTSFLFSCSSDIPSEDPTKIHHHDHMATVAALIAKATYDRDNKHHYYRAISILSGTLLTTEGPRSSWFARGLTVSDPANLASDFGMTTSPKLSNNENLKKEGIYTISQTRTKLPDATFTVQLVEDYIQTQHLTTKEKSKVFIRPNAKFNIIRTFTMPETRDPFDITMDFEKSTTTPGTCFRESERIIFSTELATSPFLGKKMVALELHSTEDPANKRIKFWTFDHEELK